MATKIEIIKGITIFLQKIINALGGNNKMAYNHKTAQQKPYSKLLLDQVDEYDTSNHGCKNYDKMLEEERKDDADHTDKGSLVMEKQLEKEQKTADYEILEKKLNTQKTDLNEYSSSFRNDKGAHPMDYFQEGEKAEKKAYNAAEEKKKDKRKMDEIAGEQMIGEKTTIVGNEYKSQLLSNYDSREDFEKKNKAIKEASTTLLEADAYLFAIYKTANEAGRPLSEKEQLAVDSVTEAKIKVLAQLEGWTEDLEDESTPIEIEGDRLEEQLEFNSMSEDTGLEPEMTSEPVNMFQWAEKAKAEINAAETGQYGEIIDRLLGEAKNKFDMNFREAEEFIRDEVLS